MYENYRELACAIIYRACIDFKEGRICEDSFKNFIRKTEWIDYLSLNRELIIREAIKGKEEYLWQREQKKLKKK